MPILAKVIPMAVTDNKPVPYIISSAKVKQKSTIAKRTGDFKNSGTRPASKNHPLKRPQNHPKKTANKPAIKNNKRVVTPIVSDAKKEIISNAKTANNTPIGSTIIPSHFKIFAGRGFKLD